jgi:hypothetical protein
MIAWLFRSLLIMVGMRVLRSLFDGGRKRRRPSRAW